MSEGSPEDAGGPQGRRGKFRAAAGLRWLAARVEDDAADAARGSSDPRHPPASEDASPGEGEPD